MFTGARRPLRAPTSPPCHIHPLWQQTWVHAAELPYNARTQIPTTSYRATPIGITSQRLPAALRARLLTSIRARYHNYNRCSVSRWHLHGCHPARRRGGGRIFYGGRGGRLRQRRTPRFIRDGFAMEQAPSQSRRRHFRSGLLDFFVVRYLAWERAVGRCGQRNAGRHASIIAILALMAQDQSALPQGRWRPVARCFKRIRPRPLSAAEPPVS